VKPSDWSEFAQLVPVPADPPEPEPLLELQEAELRRA
jgi:hypothetical protein